MKVKKIQKLIIISAISFIAVCQLVFTTASVCKSKENIQMIYEVKQGENLFSVAQRFGTTAEKLQKLNNINGFIVDQGTRLKID